jgi:hypothetical protein
LTPKELIKGALFFASEIIHYGGPNAAFLCPYGRVVNGATPRGQRRTSDIIAFLSSDGVKMTCAPAKAGEVL